MDAQHAISQLRNGETVEWPANSQSEDFAQFLDDNTTSFRDQFIIPTKAQLKRKTLIDDAKTSAPANNTYVRCDPNTMDVDATREEARTKGLCYKCKKPGHQFFECPEKKQYATRKVDV